MATKQTKKEKEKEEKRKQWRRPPPKDNVSNFSLRNSKLNFFRLENQKTGPKHLEGHKGPPLTGGKFSLWRGDRLMRLFCLLFVDGLAAASPPGRIPYDCGRGFSCDGVVKELGVATEMGNKHVTPTTVGILVDAGYATNDGR